MTNETERLDANEELQQEADALSTTELENISGGHTVPKDNPE
jgi:bacteriocin-like protein